MELVEIRNVVTTTHVQAATQSSRQKVRKLNESKSKRRGERIKRQTFVGD
jgi:hypothetical protein